MTWGDVPRGGGVLAERSWPGLAARPSCQLAQGLCWGAWGAAWDWGPLAGSCALSWLCPAGLPALGGGSCPPPYCPQGSLSHGWVPGGVRSPGNSPQGGWEPPVPRGGGSPCSPGEGAGHAAGWGWGMPRGCWAGARGMHRSHWGGQRGRHRAALGRERPQSGEGAGGCPGGPGEGAGVYWRGGRGCAQQTLAKAVGIHGERRGAGEGPGVGDWESRALPQAPQILGGPTRTLSHRPHGRTPPPG